MRPGAGRLTLVLVALGVVVAFLAAMLSSTGGRFVPQVVDLYVVCQYAQALAEGHPFRYNPGEPPSTGATSLLYTAWLGAGHAVGFRGEGLVAFAILSGAALYVASVLLARRVGERVAGEPAGLLAGGLVALSGTVVWSFLYGSDIAAFLFLALLLLDRWLVFWEGGSARGFALAGSLVALARPEGLPLGLLLALASRRRPAAPRGREAFLALAPAAAGLAVLALNRAVTGSWLGTSVADKSLLANYGLLDSVRLVAEYATDLTRGVLFGFYPPETAIGFARGWAPYYLPPLALPLVVAALVGAPEARRAPLRLWLLAAAAVSLLVSANMFMGVHYNRYVLWSFPGLLVLTAAGITTAASLVPDPGRRRTLLGATAGLFLALGLLQTLRFAASYGSAAGAIARRELALAEWIRRELPPGVAMANVATSVEYLTGHRNVNLHGVTSPAFFGTRTAEREAGMLESLVRMPPGERPPYLISSAALQQASPLLRRLVEGPPLYRTASLSDELLVFRTRWDLLDRAPRLHAPSVLEAAGRLTEVDRLNVCDGEDERRHGYRYASGLGELRFHGAVLLEKYPQPAGPSEEVADAGRVILGSETFRVRSRRGRDLLLVLRTAKAAPVALRQAALTGLHTLEQPRPRLEVRANGVVLARLEVPLGSGWSEVALTLPGSGLSEPETELTVSGHYASFRYWFFQ